MMTLACKQLGMKDCDFVARSEDKYEVEGKVLDHAVHVHGDKMMGMNGPAWGGLLHSMDDLLTTA